MAIFPFTREANARIGLALAIAFLAGSPTARAAIDDFVFQPVDTDLKTGEAIELAVRLIDRRSGAVVPDAVIYAVRLDMAPDGMATMTAPVEVAAATEPGVYRFRTDLPMAGRWRLSLAAKIQGEFGTLVGRLILRAEP